MKDFKKTVFLILVAVMICASSVMFTACASSKDFTNDYGGGYPNKSESNDAMANGSGDAGESIIVTTTDRMIVYYVSVSVTVKDTAKTMNELKTKTTELGGYEQESYQNNNGYTKCIFRIPTEKLDEFVNEISGKGKINDKTVTTEDITELYTNAIAEKSTLEARKTALEAMLAREDLTLEDEIAISKELSDVDSKLNRYEKQINNYKKQSEFSTVTVSLFKEGEKYEEPSFWDKLSDTFMGSGASIGKVFGGILMAIVAVFPYLAIIGGIFGLYVLIKYIVCKKKNIPFTLFKKLRDSIAYRKERNKFYAERNKEFQREKQNAKKTNLNKEGTENNIKETQIEQNEESSANDSDDGKFDETNE